VQERACERGHGKAEQLPKSYRFFHKNSVLPPTDGKICFRFV
jgi:hypothetical protein